MIFLILIFILIILIFLILIFILVLIILLILILFVLLLLLTAPAIYFLAGVKDLPSAALQQYYADWRELELKREQKELRQAALYLYPNSVIRQNIDAATLLNVDLSSTNA